QQRTESKGYASRRLHRWRKGGDARLHYLWFQDAVLHSPKGQLLYPWFGADNHHARLPRLRAVTLIQWCGSMVLQMGRPRNPRKGAWKTPKTPQKLGFIEPRIGR